MSASCRRHASRQAQAHTMGRVKSSRATFPGSGVDPRLRGDDAAVDGTWQMSVKSDIEMPAKPR